MKCGLRNLRFWGDGVRRGVVRGSECFSFFRVRRGRMGKVWWRAGGGRNVL